jgi:predicted ArsR family transcriptional regulator
MDWPTPAADIAAGNKTRQRILESLQAVDVALHPLELAVSLDLHVNTVRHHLEVLESMGVVTRHSRPTGANGHPRVTYALTDTAMPTERAVASYYFIHFLASYVAGEQGQHGRKLGAAVGERWGQHLINAPPYARTDIADALEHVAALLRRLGFGRSRTTGPEMIRIAPMSLGSIAEDYPDLVAGVYAGIVSGALKALGAPVEVLEVTEDEDGGLIMRCQSVAAPPQRITLAPSSPLGEATTA